MGILNDISTTTKLDSYAINVYCIVSALFFSACGYAQLNDPLPYSVFWFIAYIVGGTVPNLYWITRSTCTNNGNSNGGSTGGNGGSTGGNGGRGCGVYTAKQAARYGSNGVSSTINGDGNGNFDSNGSGRNGGNGGNGGNGNTSATSTSRVLTLARRSTKKREDTRNMVRKTLLHNAGSTVEWNE